MRLLKRSLSLLLVICMVVSLTAALTVGANAANVWTINGKSFTYQTFTTNQANCWSYAQDYYTYIWGSGFNSYRNDSTNILKDYSASDLTLTADHLRNYISAAALGSVIRYCSAASFDSGDDDGYGHSAILVAKSDSGFTVVQGGVVYRTGSPKQAAETTYTWSDAASRLTSEGKQYIKYIKCPNGGSSTYLDIGTDFIAVIYPTNRSDNSVVASNNGNAILENEVYSYSQRWHFVRNSDGSYYIRNVADGGYLDVANADKYDGANVQVITTNTGSDAQKWYICNGNYGYLLIPKHCTSKALDCTLVALYAGTNIEIWARNGTAAQGFAIYKTADPCYHTDTTLRNYSAATCTSAGYSGDRWCTYCNTQLSTGSVISALGHHYVNGICSNCGQSYSGSSMTMTDVKAGSYYYDAVLWAAAKGITDGTSATTFSPDKACTRAQVVTFLWRAAGKPNPTSTTCKFQDVKNANAYYYKAVLWAVEKGITTGTSATKFSPDKVCTRAEIVTFLWRYAGKPAPAKTTCSFKDVRTTDFYYTAVLWAANQNPVITSGTSTTTFSPNTKCTRAQIVTFLYRQAGCPSVNYR